MGGGGGSCPGRGGGGLHNLTQRVGTGGKSSFTCTKRGSGQGA